MSAEGRPASGRGGEVRAAAAPRSPPLPLHTPVPPPPSPAGLPPNGDAEPPSPARRGSGGRPASARSLPGARGRLPFSQVAAGACPRRGGCVGPRRAERSGGAGEEPRALSQPLVQGGGAEPFWEGRTGAGAAQVGARRVACQPPEGGERRHPFQGAQV